MALFNFKKKDNTTAPTCACSGGCTLIEAAEVTSTCCHEAAAGTQIHPQKRTEDYRA